MLEYWEHPESTSNLAYYSKNRKIFFWKGQSRKAAHTHFLASIGLRPRVGTKTIRPWDNNVLTSNELRQDNYRLLHWMYLKYFFCRKNSVFSKHCDNLRIMWCGNVCTTLQSHSNRIKFLCLVSNTYTFPCRYYLLFKKSLCLVDVRFNVESLALKILN